MFYSFLEVVFTCCLKKKKNPLVCFCPTRAAERSLMSCTEKRKNEASGLRGLGEGVKGVKGGGVQPRGAVGSTSEGEG